MPNQKVPASYLITAPLVRPRPRSNRMSEAGAAGPGLGAVAPTITVMAPVRSAVRRCSDWSGGRKPQQALEMLQAARNKFVLYYQCLANVMQKHFGADTGRPTRPPATGNRCGCCVAVKSCTAAGPLQARQTTEAGGPLSNATSAKSPLPPMPPAIHAGRHHVDGRDRSAAVSGPGQHGAGL
jgi:hypothetical protein